MAFNAVTGMWELDAPTSKGAAAAKIPVLPQTPEALAEVAKLTRAARVAQYGEPAVAAMEAAGQRFGAGISSAAPPAAAPLAAPTQGFIARELPTFAKGFGALRSAASTVAPFVAPAVEAGRVVASAVDPTQSKGETGLRTLMGAGRLAGMGAGAALGSALGPVGTIVGGAAGYMLPDVTEWGARKVTDAFSAPAPATIPLARGTVAPGVLDPTMNAETAVTSPPAPPAVPGFGALPPVAPFTAQDIRATNRVPVSGTGAFVNNTTGVVTNLDTRAAQAAEAAGTGTYQPRSPAAQFFGAGMRQRQAAKAEDRAAAQAKLEQDYALKLPGAIKDQVQAAETGQRLQEAARARAAGASPAEVSAILSGRSQAQPKVSVFPGLMPGDPVIFADTGARTAESVVPRQRVQLVQGTDGKTYKRDAAGKLVEATPAELAAYRAAQQQRGFGAVR